MARVWRGMKAEGELPLVSPGKACGLGVRTGDSAHTDILVDAENKVTPGTAGMSVSSSLDNLPMHRLPRRLKQKHPERFSDAIASNNYFCWCLGDGEFVASPIATRLCFLPDPQDLLKHGFIEPDSVMLLAEYESALCDTQAAWLKWEE